MTSVLVGYDQVSTFEQLLDRQLRTLTAAGCGRVFTDQLSGRDGDRPQLRACLDYLRPGDTALDRRRARATMAAQPLSEPELEQLVRARTGDMRGLRVRDDRGNWATF